MEMENERSQIKFQRTKGKGRKQNRKLKYPNLLFWHKKKDENEGDEKRFCGRRTHAT
jgi:hypothetical protein